jgi:hypothetical protein
MTHEGRTEINFEKSKSQESDDVIRSWFDADAERMTTTGGQFEEWIFWAGP